MIGKICFVNTPLQDYSKGPKKEYRTMAPLGLAYVATVAKRAGVEVGFIDAEREGLSPAQIEERVRNEGHDTVGINLVSPTVEISRLVIDRLSDLTIVGGGPHATLCPDKSFQDIPAIDFLIRDEGELTMQDLAQGKPVEEIRGLSYRVNGKVVHNPAREKIMNLNSLPYVDRTLFDEGDNKASVMTTRGCPYDCTYCSVKAISGAKIRSRSVENILGELEYLVREFGIRQIHFVDDNFIYNKAKNLGIAQGIIDRGLQVEYRGLARVDLVCKVGEEVLSKMAESGFRQLTFGIETGTQRIQEMIKKGITLEQSKEAVALCRKVGIKTKGYFMIGFPTETADEMRQTIQFAKELDLDEPWFVITRAYPGTALFQQLGSDPQYLEYDQLDEIVNLKPEELEFLKEKGVSFDKFVKYGALNRKAIGTLSTKELVEMLREAYKTVYSEVLQNAKV